MGGGHVADVRRCRARQQQKHTLLHSAVGHRDGAAAGQCSRGNGAATSTSGTTSCDTPATTAATATTTTITTSSGGRCTGRGRWVWGGRVGASRCGRRRGQRRDRWLLGGHGRDALHYPRQLLGVVLSGDGGVAEWRGGGGSGTRAYSCVTLHDVHWTDKYKAAVVGKTGADASVGDGDTSLLCYSKASCYGSYQLESYACVEKEGEGG